MMHKQLRKLHRWIFIFMGVFIVMWLLSGILMVMPAWWFGPTAYHQNPAADYSMATLSPAEAIERLNALEATGKVKQISIRQINETILYSVRLEDGDTRLINAGSGEPFEFTEELAVSIIRNSFKVDTPLLKATRLTKHDRAYPWGDLPAWRIIFESKPSHSYTIVESSLKVFRSSMATRLRTAITSLHEFEPVMLVTGNPRIRNTLIMLVAVIALAGAIIGVWLTLPHKRKPR